MVIFREMYCGEVPLRHTIKWINKLIRVCYQIKPWLRKQFWENKHMHANYNLSFVRAQLVIQGVFQIFLIKFF